jgi:hypothetical protein
VPEKCALDEFSKRNAHFRENERTIRL